ncbi:hypothetical protein ACHWQZ_G010698 [Mnemiopsis leidyi]
MTKRKETNVANGSDPTPSSLSIPNQRNLKSFLTNPKLPHIVCLSVKESNFLVNSIVLCLHSSVFESDISALASGDHTLLLHKDLIHVDDIESTIRDCLEYMHATGKSKGPWKRNFKVWKHSVIRFYPLFSQKM